jgi:Flp pilus assembly protein CpaB
MSPKVQRILWFVAGNAVGIIGLMLAIAISKSAKLSEMNSAPRGSILDRESTPSRIGTQNSQSPITAETVNVVVIGRDLPVGASLKRSDIKLEPMPKAFVHEKCFEDLNLLVGKKIKIPLEVGDVISSDMLIDH